jgi:hypothetical protein
MIIFQGGVPRTIILHVAVKVRVTHLLFLLIIFFPYELGDSDGEADGDLEGDNDGEAEADGDTDGDSEGD